MAHSERKSNKTVSVILGIIAAILIIAAAFIAINHYWHKSDDYSQFKNGNSSKTEKTLANNPINFPELKTKYPDVCAWIKFDSEDIDIDYPIVCSGEDKKEDYYLRRDLDGKYSTGGTVYIQKLNKTDFSDPCTLVYGHNMTNLSMFGTLKYLRDKEVFDRNEFFYIYTPGHILKYDIKSAFVYDDRHILYSFDFTNEHDFLAFADEASNPQSLVKNVRENVSIKNDSKLAVLSTCTNIDSERYLVVGVLTEDTKTK